MQTKDLEVGKAHEVLRPYLPRLVIEWLRDRPEDVHRRVDGSLAFVDISGFTKLCERLARKGKVGAEEVNDVLDLCFTDLLAVGYEYGGGVVKWGGDAVCLLFDGPGHAVRASRAAHGMRRALRGLSRLRTSAGLVSLRMSVGVHSGAFDFFLVGNSHRELLLTGPATTQTVLMEQAASAGEIVISSATASLLDRRLVGATRGGGHLLAGEPDVEKLPAGPVAGWESVDLAVCVPRILREYLVAGGGETEHRHITVAFIQFRGVDDPVQKDGPDSVARDLEELIVAVQEAADNYDVSFHETDIDADGGKVILVAGAPRVLGNDEERALRALRMIADRRFRFDIRIGVNDGAVFTGDFGPPYRRSYSMKGDAVNLAARIMGKAQPGQILATASVLERSPTRFQQEALEPFPVKGKKHPVQAFSVGPLLGSREAEPAEGLPLVGREREMGVLLEALEASRAGRGRFVDIVGEPGIGKSRLLEELRSAAAPAETLWATCDPYESSTPYHPFRDLLRRAVGIPEDADPIAGGRLLAEEVGQVAPHLAPWLPLLAVPMYLEVPSTDESDQLELEFKKARLEQATSELLALVLSAPTVLIFEDVHWMDEASSDLLRTVAHGIEERPWVVCLSRRDQASGFVPGSDLPVETLRPRPLSAEEAARLATTGGDDSPLSDHAIAALAERSGGNPLFLRELVLASRSSQGMEALPDTVEALLAAQIDRLAAPDRRVLRYASVLGVRFSRNLLESTIPDHVAAVLDPDTWMRISDFLETGPGGMVRFRHALIRDAAYEGLPYRRRRELHARVGETIERSAEPAPEEQAELLSLHFFEAQIHDKAWRYARIAGDRAQTKFANVEAVAFYRRAVDAARATAGVEPFDLTQVYGSLGDVSERAGLYGEAASAYRSARGLVAGQPVEEARLLLKEGIIRERSGRYAQAMGWWRRGLRALEAANGGSVAASTRAQLSVWYAAARRQQGRLDEAIRWCHRAIEAAEEGGDKDALAHAFRLLDWIHTDRGSAEGVPFRDRALALYEELGDLSGQSEMLNQLGIDAYFEGRWDQAMEFYRRANEAAERTGDAVNAAHGTNNIAEILSDQGHLAEAEERFTKVLRVWKAAGFRLGVAFATSNLGRVAARSGRHEEAGRLLDEAALEFRAIGAEGQGLETDARMWENALLAGDLERALEGATEALARVEALGGQAALRSMLHRLRGYALLPTDAEAARDAFEASLLMARTVTALYEVALSLDAMTHLPTLAGDRSAEEYREEASSVLKRLGVVSLPKVPLTEAAVSTPQA